MPNGLADLQKSACGLDGKTVEELLFLVADEEQGYKPEALERLLEMGLETNYALYESAVRNDDNADLRNSAMEVLVKFGKNSVHRLVRLLRDRNEEVRNFATVMLGDIGSREAVGALIQALADPDTNVSHGAAEALGKIGDRAALLPLIELLRGEFWLQYAAINAIGEMRDQRAVPHLLQLLHNDMLAGPIIEALGKIGDPRTLTYLTELLPSVDDRLAGLVVKSIVSIQRSLNETLSFKNTLSDCGEHPPLNDLLDEKGLERLRQLVKRGQESETVDAAVTMLGWIGDTTALADFFELLRDDRYLKSVETAILAIGKPAVACILDALSSENENVQVVAIRSLRWLGSGETEKIAPLLSSPNRLVQLECIESLRFSADSVIIPPLQQLVMNGDDELALRAAEILGKFPYAAIREFHLSLVKSNKVGDRRRAAMFSGYLQGDLDTFLLDALGHDEDADVRREILKSVGLKQATEGVPLLQQALSDPDEGIREQAVFSMAELRDPLFLPSLQLLLGSGSEILDYAVIKAIGTIGSAQGGESLVDYLNQGGITRRIEYAIIETLGKISYRPASGMIANHYLRHLDPDIRRLAVETLGNLGDPASLESVESAARDPHWSVRIAALHVLGNSSSPRGLPILLAAVEDSDFMVRKHAVITLGDLRNVATLPELVKQLTDMEMSRYAFEAILKFGRSALPWLHRMMKKNYSIEVRERVIDLIGKIGDRRSVEPLLDLLEDSSAAIRLAAIDSLVFCFDSIPLKKLVALKKNDSNEEVKKRADLALKTLVMEKFF